MLNDSERDLIDERIEVILSECSRDYAVAETRVREEYSEVLSV